MFILTFFSIASTVVISLIFSWRFLEAIRLDKAYEKLHRAQVFPTRVLVPKGVI